MTQYAYLRTNKFEREVQIFISCNVLYMMTQYAYLQTNKFVREVQLLISCNVLYMTTKCKDTRERNEFSLKTQKCFVRIIKLIIPASLQHRAVSWYHHYL